jgi:hypothetical protein
MNADNHGLPPFVTELWRTSTDVSGWQSRGLQNRLRGVRRRLLKFTFVHQRPHRKPVTANDSQDARPSRLPRCGKVGPQGRRLSAPCRGYLKRLWFSYLAGAPLIRGRLGSLIETGKMEVSGRLGGVSDVRALTFDIFGTTVDWRGG